ncbi:MAG TPA: S8 family serine peptidase, partial [Polyangiaceae bacterium]|nr:S8 family serine peptidase [Polyangiaceae bacterium]
LDENGATRVRWLIDFTRPPAGLPGGAALETALDCDGARQCAVYSKSDLSALLSDDVEGNEPRDEVGHGTHVASIATSNGRSSSTRQYAGVAPEADLVIARVTTGESGITDPIILDATRFVFERAKELGEPAVVNLSLGSDLGAHDGSSALERALGSLVGPSEPGRAIVVAAGNSGGLYRSVRKGFPDPFGIHTEVHVPRESTTRVSVITPVGSGISTLGRVSVWIMSQPDDELSIGVARRGKLVGGMVPRGEAAQMTRGDLNFVIFNTNSATNPNTAIVMIDGEWTSGEVFDLVFEGHGTASLWMEGAGDVDPAISIGPLFPLAQKEGTINVPAASPELIAVGATFNRADWIDIAGVAISRPSNGALQVSPPDTIAYFSAAGPNALGVIKPDIVAPGSNVIAAMAAAADPRVNSHSSFAGTVTCGSAPLCLVVDDFHAVASGTSMAAPMVSGVVALLLQQNPTLTQPELRALLQAGARRLEGAESFEPQVGPGAVDAHGALDALTVSAAQTRLPGSASWISLATSYAHPDPTWPVRGYAELRDDDGHVADGFDPGRLLLVVRGGVVSSPLQRILPGLYEFAFAAPNESGGTSLELSVRFDENTVAHRTVPIAVDRGALNGLAVPRGGCGFATTNRGFDGAHWLLALVALLRRRRVKPAS